MTTVTFRDYRAGQTPRHYFHGGRGLGQSDGESVDIEEGGYYIPPPADNPTQVFLPSGSLPSASSGGGTPVSSGTGFNLTSLLNNVISTAGGITKQLTNPLFNLPAGTYYQQTPYGTVVSTAGAISPTTTDLSSLLPWLLIGGVGLVLVMGMSKR